MFKKSLLVSAMFVLVLLSGGCASLPVLEEHYTTNPYKGPVSEHTLGSYAFSLPVGFSPSSVVSGVQYTDKKTADAYEGWPYMSLKYEISFTPWAGSRADENRDEAFKKAWQSTRQFCLEMLGKSEEEGGAAKYSENLNAGRLFGKEAVTMAYLDGKTSTIEAHSYVKTSEGIVSVVTSVPSTSKLDISAPGAAAFKRLTLVKNNSGRAKDYSFKLKAGTPPKGVLVESLKYASSFYPYSDTEGFFLFEAGTSLAGPYDIKTDASKEAAFLNTRNKLSTEDLPVGECLSRVLTINGRQYEEQVGRLANEYIKRTYFMLKEVARDSDRPPFAMRLTTDNRYYHNASSMWHSIVSSLKETPSK